ncbi:hypothetical protein RJT34_25568 [Clitoria ternatea]|uniref:Uncharacterized protein n=1 Tax=Clitoria ternatea TaxID=43366 RepID=A0AAN9FSA2_CLITE
MRASRGTLHGVILDHTLVASRHVRWPLVCIDIVQVQHPVPTEEKGALWNIVKSASVLRLLSHSYPALFEAHQCQQAIVVAQVAKGKANKALAAEIERRKKLEQELVVTKKVEEDAKVD